ncbi:MAG: hypothetical protein LBT53_07045 [Puniceicoccales bacterium]|jgi:hypothetical protein|nr:hypothetical protein [Puniceicoccales bacterium]
MILDNHRRITKKHIIAAILALILGGLFLPPLPRGPKTGTVFTDTPPMLSAKQLPFMLYAPADPTVPVDKHEAVSEQYYTADVNAPP